MARTLMMGGVGPRDVVQNAYGYGLFTGGLGFHYGAERLGAAVIPISGGFTDRQLTALQDFGSTVPCSMYQSRISDQQSCTPCLKPRPSSGAGARVSPQQKKS